MYKVCNPSFGICLLNFFDFENSVRRFWEVLKGARTSRALSKQNEKPIMKKL